MSKSQSNPPKIVLTGSLAVDQILHYDGILAEHLIGTDLKNLSLSVLLAGFEKTQGGVAGNIAYSLALLGEKPILFASLGHDQAAYLSKLKKLGADTTSTHLSQLPTASFTVLTDKVGCQIGGFYPGAMADASSLSLHKYADKNVLVVVSAHDPAQMAIQLEEAARLKLRLVFDLGQQVATLNSNVMRLGLKTAEVLLVNEYELKLLAQKSDLSEIEILNQVPLTIVTLGEKGCLIYSKTLKLSPTKISAVKAQLIDPTGAGDAFRAGFLYAYVRSWPIIAAAKLAMTLAAIAVESHGTQLHHFTKTDLEIRHQRQYHQQINWK